MIGNEFKENPKKINEKTAPNYMVVQQLCLRPLSTFIYLYLSMLYFFFSCPFI